MGLVAAFCSVVRAIYSLAQPACRRHDQTVEAAQLCQWRMGRWDTVGDSIRGAGKSSATDGLYGLWPIFDHVDGQKSTLGERLNSCVKQQQQPFHESEMLCVQHAGSSLLVVFFSL